MTLWLLGDQLNLAAVLAHKPVRVLLIEADELGQTPPMHPQKLVLFFSAMRHMAQALQRQGLEVVYLQAPTVQQALAEFYQRFPSEPLYQMQPADSGFVQRVQPLVQALGGDYLQLDNPLWIVSPAVFDGWAGTKKRYWLEGFYRFARSYTGLLMNHQQPEGGAWNFDAENRKPLPRGHQPPSPLRFAPDTLTQTVMQEVQQRFKHPFGQLEGFDWPVTRTQALAALQDFIDHRLPHFGAYQDALSAHSWSVYHSLLSPALNLGLLHPLEVCQRVEAAYRQGGIPLSSAEGFIRQVLGWREYIYHVYRREHPSLLKANTLQAHRPLPPLYWGAPTQMRCVDFVLQKVQQRAYAHHIERLMVLANLALLYGASPQQTNDWFIAAFLDSAEWVMAPNVLGMGLYAWTGLSTKPYAASGKYIERMGQHCQSCVFTVAQSQGHGACPFNVLYWAFLHQHRELLQRNPRMSVLYRSWDKRSPQQQAALLQQAEHIKQNLATGQL